MEIDKMATFAKTDRVEKAAARAYAAATAAPQYRTDSRGRTVRVFTRDAPLSWEQVRNFLVNKRVVEEDEALEEIGYNGFRTQIASGTLVKHGNFYWITARAAARYDLPKPTVANGAVCEFPRA